MSPWRRIGWRNLGRNPRRTVLTALGLAVGYFAVVFIIGWAGGITAELVENATSLAGGAIEIHHREYLPDRGLHDTLGGREGVEISELLEAVEAAAGVAAAAPRAYGGGLVSSGEATVAATLCGVDPQREIRVTRFLNPLVGGRMPATGANEVVIGEEMARQLAVTTGDELVVVVSAADGSMGNDLFTVAGIFRTGLAEFDAATAVVPLADLQTLAVLGPRRIHQILVATGDPTAVAATAAGIAASIGDAPGRIAVAPWTELNPVLSDYVTLAGSMYWLIIVIVFAMASFGVANTMLMASFERRREFAVMLALGAAPRSVVLTVLGEAFAIGCLSLGIGGAISLPLMAWFYLAPPSLGGLWGNVTLQGALLTPSLRVGLDPVGWAWATAGLLLTAVVAGLWPALRASRTPPADTLAGH